MPISTIGSNSLNQTSDLTINGQTVGKGGGNVATNTAHGVSALNGNSSGTGVTAIGSSALPVSTASNNTAIGRVAGNNTTSGSDNTFLGMQSGYTNVTGVSNVYAGVSAGYTATGSYNTFVGQGSGETISSGAKNSILGRYNGNQGGLDIRTASNRVVLSDGDGNPRLYADNNGGWQSTSAVGNNTLYPAQFCRAWVWFNGADASIFGSANVSSVTRLANGSYTVNFTVAFPDNLYTGVTGFSRIDASAQFVNLGFSRTSSTDRVETFVNGSNAALSTIQIAYFR